jgi:hypothetical protein
MGISTDVLMGDHEFSLPVHALVYALVVLRVTALVLNSMHNSKQAGNERVLNLANSTVKV